jgi:hypothetical protein
VSLTPFLVVKVSLLSVGIRTARSALIALVTFIPVLASILSFVSNVDDTVIVLCY